MQRAVATSLPLATAAAVATLLAAPAGADPVGPSAVPTTPAQPGGTQAGNPSTQNKTPAQPGVTKPGQQSNDTNTPQPGVTSPQPGVTAPQPGVTQPNSDGTQPDQNLTGPVQPGVTTPRVAPLPVPGQNAQEQNGPAQPAIMPGPNETQPQPNQQPQPSQDNTNTLNGPSGNGNAHQGTVQAPPRWNSPSLHSAPAAPVVQMNGPHTEVGANIDGGSVAPGYVANTHHFNNANGYVGTVGYRTPTGTGDAGVSIEYVEANKIKVTTYTHTTGIDDLKARTGFNDVKNETYIDSTQANAAKAAVEGWIRMQPGGVAALDAAAHVGKLPEGNYAPQTVNVAGVTTQWSGSVQN